MKLTFLGTGAADWDICAYTPSSFFRRFCSVLVDRTLLIDPGPHIFHYAQTQGVPDLFDQVKNIIVTHSHADHFSSQTVLRLCGGTDRVLWGDDACYRKLLRELSPNELASIAFRPLALRQAESIGDYTVTSLRANHVTEDANEVTRVYLIERDGRICFYGCDSAWLPTESWNVLKNASVNVMVMELTCGAIAKNDWRIFEHNTIEMLELMLTTFRKYNHFAPDVRYYVSHMARTLHTDHETLVQDLSPLGVTPAYDGMTLEV